MKKYLTLFLSFLIIWQCAFVANAVIYDSDSRYTVDLPDEYRQVSANKFATDDNSEFSVNFEDNKEEQFCVADMSDKDIEEYIETMEAESKAVLEEYDVDGSLDIISAEKIKHPNGRYALVIIVETKYTVDGTTTVNYQKLYGFSGVENKITFTYTVDDKERLNEADEVFNSIVVNEKAVESKLDKLKTVGFYAGVVLVLLVVVVLFVKRRSK